MYPIYLLGKNITIPDEIFHQLAYVILIPIDHSLQAKTNNVV